jgi:hypothetical protein
VHDELLGVRSGTHMAGELFKMLTERQLDPRALSRWCARADRSTWRTGAGPNSPW